MANSKSSEKTKEEKRLAFLQRAAAWNPNIRKKLEKIQQEQKENEYSNEISQKNTG